MYKRTHYIHYVLVDSNLYGQYHVLDIYYPHLLRNVHVADQRLIRIEASISCGLSIPHLRPRPLGKSIEATALEGCCHGLSSLPAWKKCKQRATRKNAGLLRSYLWSIFMQQVIAKDDARGWWRIFLGPEVLSKMAWNRMRVEEDDRMLWKLKIQDVRMCGYAPLWKLIHWEHNYSTMWHSWGFPAISRWYQLPLMSTIGGIIFPLWCSLMALEQICAAICSCARERWNNFLNPGGTCKDILRWLMSSWKKVGRSFFGSLH